MRNIGTITFVIFGGLCALLVGAAFLYFSAPTMAEAQTWPTEPAALATATLYAEPSATPSPTMIMTPTENTAATVAVLNVTAAADNARAAAMQATALVDAANIEAAAVARKAESDERVAQAAITLQEKVNEGRQIEQAGQIVAKERDRLHNEAINLSIRDKNTYANYLTGIGMIALAIGMVVIAFSRRAMVGQQQADEEETAELPAYPAGVDVRLFTASIQDEVLHAVAKAVTDGSAFTHGALTPDYISEGKLTSLQYLMVKYGCAEWSNEQHTRCILTPKGKKFLSDIAATTSPPRDDPENLHKSGRQTAIDEGFTPVGEGAA